MSTLKFDYEIMKNGVIPQLDSIVYRLKLIREEINSMDKPNFSGSNYLSETATTINNSINRINQVINWINESNRTLDNLIDSYEQEAKYLPLYTISKRDSVIKLKE